MLLSRTVRTMSSIDGPAASLPQLPPRAPGREPTAGSAPPCPGCGRAAPPLAPGRGDWGQAKAQVEVPVARLVRAAPRRAAVPGVEVPAAAPADPAQALLWPLRVSHIPRRVVAGPVPAPLPNVAVHVVQTQGVRR